MTDAAINALVTLLVVIDPIGLAPIFLALTTGTAAAARRRLAVRGVLIAAGVLVLFALAGDAVLAFVGISMPAFRIAGGMLLFLTALDMLFERRTERREKQGHDTEPASDPSVFPLATPLIAGPGAIATIILLMGQHAGSVAGQAMVLGVLAVVLGLTLGSLLICGLLERALRRTGVLVVTRLLGMLLAALSVQFVLDGLAAFGLAATG
ncbi:MAG: MarC family protein [Thermohalobaculum sp.]|nr:MarC family protein [Thermohalobaculum sp.]